MQGATFICRSYFLLRDKETKKIIAVYPFKIEGADEEINTTVRDWYYKQSCAAENRLLTVDVDVLTEQELKTHK